MDSGDHLRSDQSLSKDRSLSPGLNDSIREPRLPSINERLSYLRPSRELLEYYRKKVAEFDDEHDLMLSKLDQYKLTYEEQHKTHWELRQREDEIVELQKALSDMQVYLFQEREHVLRLYSENDRLKIRELDDRKKIHTLLSLSGVTENEVSYFFKEPPAKAIVPQKLPKKLQNAEQIAGKMNQTAKSSSKDKKQLLTEDEEKQKKDNQTLALQVEALQAQLQEQARLTKEQVDALMEDRRVKAEEYETRRLRDQDKIQMLTEKLHKTQDLLYDSTRDFLTLRYEHREHEHQWMSEKDKLLQQLDICHQELNLDQRQTEAAVLNESIDTMSRLEEFKALQRQCKEAQRLADVYREQVIQLEDQLARIREEGDVGKEMFKAKADKMAKHLEIMNKRYIDLEKRRNLEVEGFKTDIKNLRARLKDVERQLYKVTISFSEELNLEQRPDDIDMQILRNVRRTASRSNTIMDDLKTLKAKVYGLENDLRHL